MHKHHSEMLQKVKRIDSDDAQYIADSVDSNNHLKRDFQSDLELDSASLMMGKLFKLESKPEGNTRLRQCSKQGHITKSSLNAKLLNS